MYNEQQHEMGRKLSLLRNDARMESTYEYDEYDTCAWHAHGSSQHTEEEQETLLETPKNILPKSLDKDFCI